MPGMAQRSLHRAHIEARGRWRGRRARTGAALPSSAPSVGVKNSATASEADSVAISVIGRYFMNCADHAGPEQQRRERGDARQRSRRSPGRTCAWRRANRPRFGGMPSAMRRSANSETMMASSTSMPTARISENSTTMLTVRPGELQAEHAGEERRRDRDADEQRGAEAEREQDDDRHQQHAGRDRVLQVRQHLPDQLRLVLREGDLDAFRPGLLAAASTTYFTASTVSIRLAPVRFDTSMVMAGRPLTRVTEVASLKVGLTVRDVAERHRGAGRRRDHRNLQHVLRLLDQRRAP